jgi:tRNA threonylcarbamoyladenosine biosynthesis protein TsaE
MITSMADGSWSIESCSVEQTRRIGQGIGEALEARDAVALIGGLGAGKTQLVKGIAAGAGVRDPAAVNSPTFVIVNEYPGRLVLYHIDAYRLAGPGELIAIGVEEMLESESAVVIEWADRVMEVLPADRLIVRMAISGPTRRRIEFVPSGSRARRLALAGRSVVVDTSRDAS